MCVNNSIYGMWAILVFISFVGVLHSSAACALPRAIELNVTQPVFVQESVPSDACGFNVSVDSHHECSCHWDYDEDLKSYVKYENASHISLQPLGSYFSHKNISCHYIQSSGEHCANFIFVIKDLYPGKHDMETTGLASKRENMAHF